MDDSAPTSPTLSQPASRLPTGDALRHLLRERLDSWEYPPPQTLAESDISMNPQLVMPYQDAPRPAAVLIGLIEREAGLNVLLTRRSDNLRRHRGQIAFPGGGIDPGETVWQAALREAEEEVGLAPSLVELVGLSTPFVTLTGYHVTPVVGFVRPGFHPQPNPEEVAEVFETPFDFLMDTANHEREERTFADGPSRWVYSIRHDERVIWGITAAMVRTLYERLTLRQTAS